MEKNPLNESLCVFYFLTAYFRSKQTTSFDFGNGPLLFSTWKISLTKSFGTYQSYHQLKSRDLPKHNRQQSVGHGGALLIWQRQGSRAAFKQTCHDWVDKKNHQSMRAQKVWHFPPLI